MGRHDEAIRHAQATQITIRAEQHKTSFTITVEDNGRGFDTAQISGGIGLIIASKKAVTCMFTPSAAGPREVYTGSISKFGLDVGATSGGEMVWTVFAPSNKKFGALAGTYAGASAEATVGAGLGANVLVGGSNRTVTLQPVSVQGQTGLNLAVGVAGLELRPAR